MRLPLFFSWQLNWQLKRTNNQWNQWILSIVPFFYDLWNIIHFRWNFTVLRDAAKLIFTVARCAKDERSRIERRMKTLGKTSCSTKTRRYSKAVCSTQRDRWKSRRTGRVARSLVREQEQNKADVFAKGQLVRMAAARKEWTETARTKWFR